MRVKPKHILYFLLSLHMGILATSTVLTSLQLESDGLKAYERLLGLPQDWNLFSTVPSLKSIDLEFQSGEVKSLTGLSRENLVIAHWALQQTAGSSYTLSCPRSPCLKTVHLSFSNKSPERLQFRVQCGS